MIPKLELGKTIFEVDKYKGEVTECKIVAVTVEHWIDGNGAHRLARRYRAAGGYFGCGNCIQKEDWNCRFFLGRYEAEVACAAQHAQYKAAAILERSGEVARLNAEIDEFQRERQNDE